MVKLIAIDGEKELLNELKNLEKGKLRESVYKAVGDCCNIIAGEAKRLVPVDTGRLQRSIKTKQRKNGLTGEIFCDYPDPQWQNKKIPKNGEKEYYAFAVEFGRRGQTAHPFLWPAVANSEPETDERMGQALTEAIEK